MFMFKFEEEITKSINLGIIPGLNYCVINSNEMFFGSLGNKQTCPFSISNSIDTIYDIASLSKVVVTVTIISKLIDKASISINDNVSKYLPRFKYDDITIFDLLTHTSGLPADYNSKEIISKALALDKVYSCDKEYETGSKVLYSDIGFILLGELIEKVYNKSLDVVAMEEVFIPLEMNNTCYNPFKKDKCAPTEITIDRGMVKGIVHDEKACSLGGVAGHAGVFTDIVDLSHFVSMIMNNGVYNNKKFLSKDIIDLWFKPLVYDKSADRYRSLCWIVGLNNVVINKNGNIISFSGFTGPSISIDRDNNISIILLTNRIHPSRNNKKYVPIRLSISDDIYNELVKNKSRN